ncbi:MAG TPA: selenide, water dikinase SelD [Bryobacteraceae bacterium]|nr:selenide, water dikinase SelD [Bryobacteraceae bacterium]
MSQSTPATKLTSNAKAAGCAAKLSPKILDQVLTSLPRWADENVLIGFDTADDAGVYQLTPELALVQTVDFFTPIVDDPYTFGAVAAANALSDVYAMGGRPISSLSILAYPAKGDLGDLEQILKGGAEKMHEAGCSILGGHSIADDEIKFGYAVTGTVHPARFKANAAARAGDAIMFTKRLGTGVIATALKRGVAAEEHVAEATRSMLALNRRACEEMLRFDVHGCTDVTGFGLIGHAREMALASGVTLELAVDQLRFLPGALEYARQGAISGGLKNNREFASCVVETARELPVAVEDLLYDPQTSGGLLITLSETDAAAFERCFEAAYRIGRVLPRGEKPIRLI